MKAIQITEKRSIGAGQPVYIIAEIGINHNGSLAIAKALIDEAVTAGCDAVKFQKRTPELCVPKEQRLQERDTPWGRMTYIDYRYKVEFNQSDYEAIDAYCKNKGIDWFASCWDEESVDFIEQFNPPVYKMASASLTDHNLIRKVKNTGRPYMLSTGMSTMDEIENTTNEFGLYKVMIAHSTSAYPCAVDELNLFMIKTLQDKYPDTPIGYSGHETGLAPSLVAAALGATFIERHFTLDRAMWGSDQAASVEPQGMHRLVRDIRDLEKSLGDGIKKVHQSEMNSLKRLRRDAYITPKIENAIESVK